MTSRELTAHEIELLRIYVAAGHSINELDEARVKARDQLAASLGDDDGLIGEHVAVTISRFHQHRFDSKGFAHDHPLLHQQYMKPSPNETVRVYPREDVVRGL